MQYVAVFITKYNLSITSFVPNFRIISQVVSQKFLTEKKDHWREKKEQIKGLISNMWLFFATQCNLSLSSLVPNFNFILFNFCSVRRWPPNISLTVSRRYFFCGSLCVFFYVLFAMTLYASVYLCLVVTCWESADLLALICGV